MDHVYDQILCCPPGASKAKANRDPNSGADLRIDGLESEVPWLGATLLPFLQRAFGDSQFKSRLALGKIILLPPGINPITQASGFRGAAAPCAFLPNFRAASTTHRCHLPALDPKNRGFFLRIRESRIARPPAAAQARRAEGKNRLDDARLPSNTRASVYDIRESRISPQQL